MSISITNGNKLPYSSYWDNYGLSGWQQNGQYTSGRYAYDSQKGRIDYDDQGFIQAVMNLYQSGQISAEDLQGFLAYSGFDLGSNQGFENWLNNTISDSKTSSARNWEEHMRDTSYTSAANQLMGLGLGASSVVNAGQASHSGVATAQTQNDQIAQNKYNQNMALTRQMLSMISALGTAGIGGTAMGIARNSAASLAMKTASNATRILHPMLKYYRK